MAKVTVDSFKLITSNDHHVKNNFYISNSNFLQFVMNIFMKIHVTSAPQNTYGACKTKAWQWHSRSRSSGDLITWHKFLGDRPRDLPAFPTKNPIFERIAAHSNQREILITCVLVNRRWVPNRFPRVGPGSV